MRWCSGCLNECVGWGSNQEFSTNKYKLNDSRYPANFSKNSHGCLCVSFLNDFLKLYRSFSYIMYKTVKGLRHRIDDGLTKALTGEGGPYLWRRRRGNWGKNGVCVCVFGGVMRAIMLLYKARQIFC